LTDKIDPVTKLALGRNHQSTYGLEAVVKF
jgi:hypothetical protein